jgi:hypothetical protein|tara:strand:+ start:1441 stop:2307 length:867 start_codon:yes stop_codon:yes gene_type:complete
MSDMVTIESGGLPAHLKGKTKTNNLFAAAVSVGGFPVISIKGKVFHIQRGDVRELVTKAGTDDEPAPSLEVVILSVNPNKSKVYYNSGFVEGSVAKPTCYSNDGVAPATDAEEPQSKKCNVCPHNQWGSRITDSGGKGKACGDSMRLCVAAAGMINDPMLLRVPAATLKTLGLYGTQLSKRGVEPQYVITKVGFDYNVAHPALTFKAVRFVEESELNLVEETIVEESELIDQITGVTEKPHIVVEPVGEAKPIAPPVEAKKPKPAKKKVKEIEDDEVDDALDNLDFDD